MLITGAEVCGRGPVDVRIAAGRIAEVGGSLRRQCGETTLDAAGGALLPGLHDHHLHCFSLAAALDSSACGPPEVRDAPALARVLGSAERKGGWIRGVGYHESVAGPLDRERLDELAFEHPTRVQHRSGAMWSLNSAAVRALGLDAGVDSPGVERDERGRATGRLTRSDTWLRERLGGRPPSLARVSRRLARFGVTGVTDATPTNGAVELDAFVTSAERGDLLQRVRLMGRSDLPAIHHPRISRGELKWMLEDHAPPDFDELRAAIEAAHADDRCVAIHCVTRPALVFAASAIAAAGRRSGDRIEHAAVAPPDALALVAEQSLCVVTQPNFIRERGDAYLEEVEPAERAWLYRIRAWLEAGVPLGAGTDAPFGDPDPWLAMRAAVNRRSESGARLTPDEGLEPERALALFTSPAHEPGGAPRRVAAGVVADLCLLDRPWAEARSRLSSEWVRATFCDGSPTWLRDGPIDCPAPGVPSRETRR